MKYKQKMKTSDGLYQVCLFPLDVMNITQVSGPLSYSHCCGHPFDCVGLTSKWEIYAPVDCKLIYLDGSNVGNTRCWQSLKPVYTPGYGLTYVCFSFTHDDNPIFNKIGDICYQGDLIGHTGIAGFVTGDHVHIDQAVGENKSLISYGVVCSSGNQCYALKDSVDPEKIFFKNDTNIVNTMGLIFSEYTGGIVPPSNRSNNLIRLMLSKAFIGGI